MSKLDKHTHVESARYIYIMSVAVLIIIMPLNHTMHKLCNLYLFYRVVQLTVDWEFPADVL